MNTTEIRNISDALDSIIYMCCMSSDSESDKMQSAISCLMDAQYDVTELLNDNKED